MLARRFTLVCLMTALFGMMFASLVARSEGPNESRSGQLRCAFLAETAC